MDFIYRTMNPKANVFGFFLYPVLSSSICVDFPFGFCEKEIAMKKLTALLLALLICLPLSGLAEEQKDLTTVRMTLVGD